MLTRIKGLKRYKDRHGTLRVYHRASRTPIDPSLTGQDLATEVARLDRLFAPKPERSGTLGGMIESYRRSPKYTGLKPRTQADYRKIIEYLAPIRDTPLVEIDPSFVAKLRDKTQRKRHTGFTNHMLAMLSSVFKHGLEYGLVDRNPVRGVENAKMPRERKKPNEAWSAEEREAVLACAWPQLRLPLSLAMKLGLRRGDICTLPTSAYKDGWLTFRAGKNDQLLTLPVVGELRADIEQALAAISDDGPICRNAKGKPWDENSLSGRLDKFFAECRKAGILARGRSLHGLRHSVASELRAAGYSTEQRKALLGHETDDMAEHYAASADVKQELIGMANLLEGRTKSGGRV